MKTKNILGLDLGSGSIGWAVISENETGRSITAMGSRIIPLSTDDARQFTQGQAITRNAERTQKRTQRKGYDRFQLRRKYLTAQLQAMGIPYAPELFRLPPRELWGLRARAVSERVSLPELGRILFHLNQKRGYKSGKSDYNTDKKQTDYVEAVLGRYAMLEERGQTIGRYFYENLSANEAYRCKDQVFPRIAYEKEFDAIMACQRRHYPGLLTDENIDILRNRIIYYQRPLKSCKHLVSLCEFEKRAYVNAKGETVYNGPKVAPRSSPLFQACKLWESINNLTLRNKQGDELYISQEQKQALFEFMNTHERLKVQDLYSILHISKAGGWWGGKAIGTGLQGNTTRTAIAKALNGCPGADGLLRFELHETGGTISTDYEQEPLYRLWHTLYSISDAEELAGVLRGKFGIEDETAIENLCRLDFVKAGYGNKSSRAMRRILPHLQKGLMYSEACEAAGFRHSDSLTLEENEARELADRLKPLAKGELRQPVVEKILNQLISVVNALTEKYGRFDEIRIELARELKQSREEREAASKAIADNERENEKLAKKIEEYGLVPTRSRIRKMKMWNESQQRCMYCNQPVNVKEFLRGYEVEVEHVIPRSLLFDDSFSNKVCACRRCNGEKKNRTAFDYMNAKGEAAFKDYLDRVETAYKKKQISKSKYEKLLMPETKIPNDFIDRQLRESQYIARKAKELLQQICRNVTTTSGSVTDFIRHTWGWDQVLHDLNFDRYREAGLTEIRESEHRGTVRREERIREWSKRLDHRHHAVDALAIACTKQGYIQRINNLSSLKDLPLDRQEGRHSLLQRYILNEPHFSTREVSEAVDGILVSFKAGKRTATPGKRYVHKNGKRILVQSGVIVPRGALSEESLYGKTLRYAKNKKGQTSLKEQYVIKYPVGSLKEKDLASVADTGIRRILQKRLDAFGGDPKKAWAKPVPDHQGRPIRSVRCLTGLSAVVPAKYDENGKAIGYVKPGNNHHIAIYTDREGKQHEHIVTFWHAVQRKKLRIPAVIDRPDEVWDHLPAGLDESFLGQLPDPTWTLQTSMQQNEMFILGMPEEEYRMAMDDRDYRSLGKYLYRVQKLTAKDYFFRYHTETKVDDKFNGVKNEALAIRMGKQKRISSFNAFNALNPHKVKITLLGEILEL